MNKERKGGKLVTWPRRKKKEGKDYRRKKMLGE